MKNFAKYRNSFIAVIALIFVHYKFGEGELYGFVLGCSGCLILMDVLMPSEIKNATK